VTADDARVSVLGGLVLFVGLLLGAYSWAAVGGHVPAAPWSPVGQFDRGPAVEPTPTTPADGLDV
jgi:hypothetical protein